MPTNLEITNRLREILRPDHASRPFLCDGSPVGCEVVLFGINPATTTPFGDYWTDVGCDKASWLQAYLAKEGRYKPTRKRIELIVEALAPEIRVLELNLYPYSSPREGALPPDFRDPRAFEYLLSLSAPRLLFVHGATPAAELARVLGCELRFREYTPVSHWGRQFDVYVDNHLAYQWSDAGVQRLAMQFKARLRNL